MLSEAEVPIITLCVARAHVCVCVRFFLSSLFLTLYIFLHLTTMYSCTIRRGWVGRGCLYFISMKVFW